jgi:hypothetical protein
MPRCERRWDCKSQFKQRAKPRGIGWLWWVVATLVAILVSFAFLSGMIGF